MVNARSAGRAKGSRRPASAVAGLVLLALLASGCSTIPVTGRKSFNIIPDSQAASLGADAYQQVLAESRVITSGPEYEMVQRVGRRIAEVSHASGLDWKFALIDEPETINAFALPGGKVAVYSGILPVAGSEAGLAAVVGHEIAHVIAEHGGERMTNQLAVQLGGAGLQALLNDNSPATRQLVLAAYGAGATVGFALPFSRSHESEADHIGLIYMAKAGYDPREAPEFWRRMEAASGSGGRPPEFLSTHPSPETRVEQLEKWMPEALEVYQKR